MKGMREWGNELRILYNFVELNHVRFQQNSEWVSQETVFFLMKKQLKQLSEKLPYQNALKLNPPKMGGI